MKKLKISIAFLMAVLSSSVFAQSITVDQWLNRHCESLEAIKEDSTSVVVRDALKSCAAVLKQWSEITDLQAKIAKSEREMSGKAPRAGAQSTGGNFQSGSTSPAKNKSSVYRNSKQAFLLSVSGFSDSMTAKIFYKGAIHTLKRGEKIGSATVHSMNADRVVLSQRGRKVALTPKTLNEIDAYLGASPSQKKSIQQGVAILTPQGIKGQLFTSGN